jgi:hypothetical protein
MCGRITYLLINNLVSCGGRKNQSRIGWCFKCRS